MTIQLDTYKRAIAMLASFERNMHLAFSPKATTDVADVKADVVRLMENIGQPKNAQFLYASFDRKVSFGDFIAALADLQVSGRITMQKDGSYLLNPHHIQ